MSDTGFTPLNGREWLILVGILSSRKQICKSFRAVTTVGVRINGPLRSFDAIGVYMGSKMVVLGRPENEEEKSININKITTAVI